MKDRCSCTKDRFSININIFLYIHGELLFSFVVDNNEALDLSLKVYLFIYF